MDEENVVYVHNGVLISIKEDWNNVFCRKMDETGNHVKWKKTQKGIFPFIHRF
jgi:hypothetical protein